MEAIRWFEEIGLADVSLVGGKGANLGELTHAGLPVPPGFVVTAAAYLEAVSESGVRARLARLLGELNADDPISLTETQRAAREEIMATPIPAEITDAIRNAYRRLGDDVAVARVQPAARRLGVRCRRCRQRGGIDHAHRPPSAVDNARHRLTGRCLLPLF
jgi:phosphoenolpyruvate synthase/pyruvate phosphate dikinase